MVVARIPIDLTWTHGSGSPGVNVFHCRYGGDFDSESGTLQGFIDALEDFYGAVAQYLPNTLTVRFNGEVTGLGTNAGDTVSKDPWQVVGGGSAGAISTALQMIIDWKTQSGGRRGRGRTFVGPLYGTVGGVDGLPAPAAVAHFQEKANDLIGGFDGSFDGAFAVWSRKDGIARDITQAVVPRKFGVLRSRRD